MSINKKLNLKQNHTEQFSHTTHVKKLQRLDDYSLPYMLQADREWFLISTCVWFRL